MLKLKLEDLCKIDKIDNNRVIICESSMFTNNPISSDFSDDFDFIKNNLISHTINIDKEKKDNELIIEDVLNLMIEKYEYEPNSDIVVDDISYFHDELNLRKLYSKFISYGSRIAHESRIGPGNNVIMPICFSSLNFALVENNYFNIYFTKYLYDKIIVFRSDVNFNDMSVPSIRYIENDEKYGLFMSDEYKYQYKVINFNSKKRDRINKFKRLIK